MAGIPQVITEDRASGAQFIEGSLRFDSSKGQYLKRKPTSDGNRKLWTWSGWLKRTPGALHDIFSAGQEVTNDGLYSRFRIDSDDCLNYRQWVNTSSLDAYLVSSMKLRDPSAYFHYVAIYDSNNSTNSDKVRFYINGQRVTAFSSNDYPGGTNSSWVNDISKTHTIGGHYDGGANNADSFWNGNMSQVYFIDGQALGPEYFGFTDPLTGTWRPKKYEGDFKIIPDNQLLYNVNTGDNGFDSGTSSRTYDATGRTFTTYSTPQTANPGGYGANSAHVYKSPDGAVIEWVISTDTTDRYVWTSTDGINWTNTGVQDTDGSVVTVNTAWLAIAGGSNSTYATVTSSTAGYGSVVGRNSFYLPMDGNSPIGEDKSGIVTPNNGSIWSNSLTSSSGFRSSEPKTNAFDGNTSSICSAVGSGTITFTSPVTFASNSTIRVFLHGGDHTVTVNGGSNQTISAGSFQTVTYSNSGNANFVMTFHRGGGADTGVRAIEIDGVLLVDGQIGNNWTPVNFGGSVELPKATGAIPILKTNEAGTVAKPGVRTDSKTYTVTASGGNYYLDGALKPTLNAYRGSSLTFDYTGATSHPLYLSSLPDGKHNSKAYSVEFDGTGDYLDLSTSSDFGLASNDDFTIECFVFTSADNQELIRQGTNNAGSDGLYFSIASNGVLETRISGTTKTTSGKIAFNSWNHISVCRSSGTLYMSINGVVEIHGSVTNSSTTGDFRIGANFEGSSFFTGQVSNVRFVKGQALYTSNFTRPSTTLTTTSQGAIASNVKLLCCQDSNATTGVVLPTGATITANGNASATNTSPFLYNTNGQEGVNTGTSNTTKITIPHWAADTLYYYCNAHSGMGSSINVTTDIFKADPYAWKCMFAMASDTVDHSPEINVNSTATSFGDIHTTTPQWLRNLYGYSKKMETGGGFRIDIELTTAEANAKHKFDTNDFTLECWFYQDGGQTSWQSLFRSGSYNNSLGSDGIALYGNGQTLWPYSVVGGSGLNWGQTGNVVPYKKWNHAAWTRQGDVNRIFANGILVKTFNNSNSWDNKGWEIGDVYTWNGGYQDARIYNGVAKYTESFFVPDTAPDIVPDTPSGITGKTNLTKITDGAVTGFESNSDYLTLAASSDFEFTGDHTIEMFIYHNTLAGDSVPYATGGSGAPDQIYISTTGQIYYAYGQTGAINSPAGTIVSGKWQHIAVTKQGTYLRAFVDGKMVAASTDHSSTIGSSSAAAYIGVRGASDHPVEGFISNLRIVKGTALYTSNFTPPTEPLTNVTNTVLLCCQSPTSATAAAVAPGSITANGNAVATNFNPFTDDINTIRGQESGYPTMNPLAKNSAITLTDGNLKIASTGNHGDKKIVYSTAQIPKGGKWYVEWHIGGPGCTLGFGINGSVDFRGTDTQIGTNTYSWGYEPNGNLFHNGNQGGSYGASSAGDVIGMTIDTSGPSVTVQWYENGVLIRNSSGTPAEFTNISLDEDYIVMMSQHSPNYDTVVNFGQKPFKFPPPDGFQSLNLSNVQPEKVIARPDKYVDVSLWTGNGLQKEIGGIKPSENATVVGGTLSNAGSAFNGSGANWATLAATNTNTAASVDFAVNLTGITRIEAAFDSPSGSGDTRGRYNGANGGNTRTGTGSGYSDIYNGSAITVTSVGFAINQNGTSGTSSDILSRFRITDSQGTRFILDGEGEPLSFKPDLVWIKSRSFSNNHHLFDSVRGPNKILRSSTTDQESTTNVMTSFNRDGFTVAEAGGNNATNDDGSTFVGWSWKAGGDKNTFNIDDVGYANASDVNMSVGALNSVTFDKSQNWTSQITGTQNGSYPFSNLFNGDGQATHAYPANGTRATFTPSPSFSNAKTVKVWYYAPTINADTFQLNGVNVGGQMTATGGTLTKTFNVDGFTSWSWSKGVGGDDSGMLRIDVDGVQLVDSGVSTPNVPSTAATGCSVGTKQGFSIIKYTGPNDTNNNSVPHGLLQAPDFIITKNLDTTFNWDIYHSSLADDKYMIFTTAEARNQGFSGRPTSKVFNTEHDYSTNENQDYIAYCWHDVPGLQKFGFYIGNGDADGPFIELGFRPAVVIIKRSDGGLEPWAIYDSSRGSTNPNPKGLYVNDPAGENDASGRYKDFLSNGFKVRGSSGEQNGSGQTYIYAAWAEAPSINLYGSQSNAR